MVNSKALILLFFEKSGRSTGIFLLFGLNDEWRNVQQALNFTLKEAQQFYNYDWGSFHYSLHKDNGTKLF